MSEFRIYALTKSGKKYDKPLPNPVCDNAEDEIKRLKDMYPNTEYVADYDLTEMSDVIAKLEKLFGILNKVYFGNKLPQPIITVQSTPQAYGHCSTKKIWTSENEARYEINIGAEYLNRPSEETAATLCHEMIHERCLEIEIADTCQNGRYHNKIFKREAEARNLKVDYDRTNGYTHTAPTDEFKNKLAENGFEMTVVFARVAMEAAEKAPRPKKQSYKYVCPVCGQSFSSTKELNVICGDCNEPFEAAGL